MSVQIQAIHGQATIVLVLVMSIVVLMFTHVTILSHSNVQVSDEVIAGEFLQMKAEGYLEDAALRYLRNSAYSGGEILNEDPYSCTITITDLGGSDRDLESTCALGGRSRSVGMQATYTTGVFTFTPVEQR